jgi:hypothetical protein
MTDGIELHQPSKSDCLPRHEMVATRVQLERWEPHVANFVRAGFASSSGKISDIDIWAAATEHHFALVAARHLLTTLELEQPSAPDVRQLLDTVEAEVLASDSTLCRFVPPRKPSPWFHEDGDWWPKPDAAGI